MAVPAIITCRMGHEYQGEVTATQRAGTTKTVASHNCTGTPEKKCGERMFSWRIDFDQMDENTKAARRAQRSK